MADNNGRMYWFEVLIDGKVRGVVAAINAQIAKEKMNATDNTEATTRRINAAEATAKLAQMKEGREMATFMEMIEKANNAKTPKGKLDKLNVLLVQAEKKGDETKIGLINERIEAITKMMALAEKATEKANAKVTKAAKAAKTAKGTETGRTNTSKPNTAAKPKAKPTADDTEFEYLVRREFAVVNGKTKWEFKDGVPEGRFPVPPVEKDTINDKQTATYKELRKAFVKADGATKENTTVTKVEEAGVLIMVYHTDANGGIDRVAAIYGGGRPAVWGQRPNGERRLMWGAADAVKFGAYTN